MEWLREQIEYRKGLWDRKVLGNDIKTIDTCIQEYKKILSLIDQANCNTCRFKDICDKKLVIAEDSQDYTDIDFCSKYSNFD